jgi:hypothetical protein
MLLVAGESIAALILLIHNLKRVKKKLSADVTTEPAG